jgi:ribosomal protein S18 acetylase RimI-like enzyme
MQSELRAADATPNGPRPRGFVRHFLLAQAAPALGLPPKELPAGLVLQGFGPRYLDEAASLIARVYSGHVDSEINDQYRSVEGSRRFLQNVVQYPGCGSFQPACSYVLLDSSGVARAVCIASTVAADVGHIPQICVDSTLQGRGVGYELMRRSILALSQRGAREVSLTVTGRNTQARSLYARLGFQPLREFDALIWEGLPD